MKLRHRIEVAIGKAEYTALTRGVSRVLGYRNDEETIDGVRVPFLIRPGRGTPIVLVHGFGGDKESWLILARLLPRRATILIPDLPGFGAAGSIPPERAAPKHQAAVLRALLDRLAFARAHVVGNSMGGGIALRFARDGADGAASITLIGSMGPTVEKSDVLRGLDEGRNLLLVDGEAGLDALLALVAERPPPMPRAMKRYLAADRLARREVEDALFRGLHEPREGEGLPTDLEAIGVPTLVIHGERDRVIHPSTGRALASRIPAARHLELRGVGHVPQLEAPRAVAEAITAFVTDVDARRARDAA